MARTSLERRFYPPSVLWLIREGYARSPQELATRLFTPELGVSSYTLRRYLQRTLARLTAAGFLDTEETLRTTDTLDRMLGSLDLSLTQLHRSGPHPVSVSPVFPSPKSNDAIPDIFVLMPFNDDLKPVYEDHIAPVVRDLELTVGRADDFFAASSIINDVWNAIYACQIVIADCTGRNPNVFYEIGIAHTVGKPTVLLTQDIQDVPFDLRHLRSIVYSYTPRGMKGFSVALSKTISAERRKLLEDQYYVGLPSDNAT